MTTHGGAPPRFAKQTTPVLQTRHSAEIGQLKSNNSSRRSVSLYNIICSSYTCTRFRYGFRGIIALGSLVYLTASAVAAKVYTILTRKVQLNRRQFITPAARVRVRCGVKVCLFAQPSGIELILQKPRASRRPTSSASPNRDLRRVRTRYKMK